MRWLIIVICLFILATDASAGPLRNFIQKRRQAKQNCPRFVATPPSVIQAGFVNPCPDGQCPLPKAMPKQK